MELAQPEQAGLNAGKLLSAFREKARPLFHVHHMCIDATTRAAADLGFTCTVIHDACTTKSLEFAGRTIPTSEVHGAFMAALGVAYAQVMSTADFRAGLIRTD